MLRAWFQTFSGESWHRDMSPDQADPYSTIFGGWLALTEQSASIVPRTHMDFDVQGHIGTFAPIRGDFFKDMYNYNKIKIVVKPGDIILFNKLCIHEVVASPKLRPSIIKEIKRGVYTIRGVQPQPLMRLFLGFRLTTSHVDLLSQPLPKGVRLNSREDGRGLPKQLRAEVLDPQALVDLPSKQSGPLYRSRHTDIAAQQDGLKTWIDTYIRWELLNEDHPDRFYKPARRTKRKADDKDGTVLPAEMVDAEPRLKYDAPLPPMHMPSLQELQQILNRVHGEQQPENVLYSPYDDLEEQMYLPHKFSAMDHVEMEERAKFFMRIVDKLK